MGVIGGDAVLDKLRFMLEDTHPDVRYNAAARLAHHGDAAAVPVLVEMLDPDEQAGVEVEKQEDMRAFKRSLITINALRATAATGRSKSDGRFGHAASGRRRSARQRRAGRHSRRSHRHAARNCATAQRSRRSDACICSSLPSVRCTIRLARILQAAGMRQLLHAPRAPMSLAAVLRDDAAGRP